MPTLPPALLARLKKRGILREEDEEEVIAESYDDDAPSAWGGASTQRPPSGAPGCPNKWNPYHYCEEFCFDHWLDGLPEERLDADYNRRRMRMLRKYPLPVNWKEVYDAGVARHYYWNGETDEVSWLSPTHPRAIIGEAAPQIARATFDKLDQQRRHALIRATAAPPERAGRQRRQRSPPPADADHSDSEQRADTDSAAQTSLPKRSKKVRIDPMDPAAYGECEEGSWSSGLDTRGVAKTGVDASVAGPLFQMRPYPAPGAILRKNAELSGKKP